MPCFKKIENEKNFVCILIKEAKSFGLNVKMILQKEIEKLLVDFDKLNQNLNHSEYYYFMEFSSNIPRYLHTVELLYEYYKHLENINHEIEKLTKIYLENFNNEASKLNECYLPFHRKMFINCVYNDSLIRDFIICMFNYFKGHHFYQKHYTQAHLRIEEIYDHLEISLQSEKNS